MLIRKYAGSDFDDVMALWKESGLLAHGADYALDIRKKMEFQPELFFVAEESGKIIGSVMVGYDGRRGWLNCLAVLPEYQKRGHGKELVEFGIGELKKLGCVKVNIQVRESNLGVVDFYSKLGFSKDRVISLGKRL
jgi:ribosomal protein S18 acetylase RimI-like enzyme